MYSQEEMEKRRLRGYELLQEGISQKEIARLLGVTAAAVSQWKKAIKKGKALEAGSVGRPSKLNSQQLDELALILGGAIDVAGFPDGQWTQQEIATLIEERFNVKYDRSTIHHILKKINKSFEVIWLSNPGGIAPRELSSPVAQEHSRQAARLILQDYSNFRNVVFNHLLPAYEAETDLHLHAHMLIHNLAAMAHNLCELDLSDEILNYVDYVILPLCNFEDEIKKILRGTLMAWRARNNTYRGNFDAAVREFKVAARLTRVLGGVEINTAPFHFLGRIILDRNIPLQYSDLQISHKTHNSFERAIKSLEISRDRYKRDCLPLSVIYDDFWIAKGQYFLSVGARKSVQALQKNVKQFAEIHMRAGQGRAENEITRISIEHDLYSLNQIMDRIKSTEELLQTVEYSYAIAETFLQAAYLEFKSGRYFQAHSRRAGHDACCITKLLHPFPTHPLYQIAHKLEIIFKEEMDTRREYEEYKINLRERITAQNGIFSHLKLRLTKDENRSIVNSIIHSSS